MFHVSVVLFFSFLLLCGISLYEYVAVHFGDKYLSFQFFFCYKQGCNGHSYTRHLVAIQLYFLGVIFTGLYGRCVFA